MTEKEMQATLEMSPEVEQLATEQTPAEDVRYTPPKRRRRWGDRKEGRLIRTLPPMQRLVPFIMPYRYDACNMFTDSFDVTAADRYCHKMIREGKVNFTFMHLLIAAYVRTVARYPSLNRFVSGQRVYARHDISVVMTIKKSMKLESPDTCIRVNFAPDDTVDEVYEKFNRIVRENQDDEESKSSFDKVMDFFTKFPRPILRAVVRIVRFFDYHGVALLPDLPFYGSMIITSMGSIGIPPVYHHLYDFGNLPVFLAFGKKYSKLVPDREDNLERRSFIDLKVVTDERICDGYYYAAAFKYMRKFIEHPELLESRPEQVNEDID